MGINSEGILIIGFYIEETKLFKWIYNYNKIHDICYCKAGKCKCTEVKVYIDWTDIVLDNGLRFEVAGDQTTGDICIYLVIARSNRYTVHELYKILNDEKLIECGKLLAKELSDDNTDQELLVLAESKYS